METPKNFIENIISEDLASNKHGGKIIVRFPPEPNGFLHVGHVKAICLNFGIAFRCNGVCHLRFDDTNPEKEDDRYVAAIKEDIQWLGFDWQENLFHSSDYFDQLYAFAVELIEKGLAYVDSQSTEKIREQRGTMTKKGVDGPHRNRAVEDNLKLFQQMKEGKYSDGECVLRAKIDMSSGNMNMRDPIIYRIRNIHHQRTGDKWCIYPMYDFTHALSDAIEHITHSLCTLEFEDHRPLYDWCVDNVIVPSKPRQIEFARLNLTYTVMSKRKLLELVEKKLVDGWDDPRMPTVSGFRRRGFTPTGIRNFCRNIGVGKKESIIDYSILEEAIREDLNKTTKRVMAVVDPLKVTITNWQQDDLKIVAPFHPQDESFGKRTLNLSNTIYIDRSDFLENPPPPKKWFRLGPNRSVRLRYGPVITCDEIIKDSQGKVIELKCTFTQGSFAGKLPEGMKKVKGIIHWLNVADAQTVEIRLYDRLFKVENPLSDKSKDFTDFINEDSLQIIKGVVEPAVVGDDIGKQLQFERTGYFTRDNKYSTKDHLVFNRVVTLRNTWDVTGLCK